MAIKKYQNRTSDRIVGPELTSSSKGGVQVSARYQVNEQLFSYTWNLSRKKWNILGAHNCWDLWDFFEGFLLATAVVDASDGSKS